VISRLRGSIVPLIAVAILSSADAAFAQQTPKSSELAVTLPITRFSGFDPLRPWDHRENPSEHLSPDPHWWEVGLGLRFTYRAWPHLAVEAQGAYFPKYAGYPYAPSEFVPYGDYRGWGKIQFFAGITSRWRLRGLNVFAKLQPGLIRYGRFPAIVTVDRSQFATRHVIAIGEVDNYSAIFPGVDLGGGIDVNVSRHFAFRADVSDVIVRYWPSPHELNPIYSTHNLQLTPSLSFKF
jgi:hypothetical protein